MAQILSKSFLVGCLLLSFFQGCVAAQRDDADDIGSGIRYRLASAETMFKNTQKLEVSQDFIKESQLLQALAGKEKTFLELEDEVYSCFNLYLEAEKKRGMLFFMLAFLRMNESKLLQLAELLLQDAEKISNE